MPDNQHDSVEIPELKSLARESIPPTNLENRVVDSLHEEGLLRRPSGMHKRTFVLWSGAAAAALLLFFSGLWVGKSGSVRALPSSHPRFMLILQGAPGPISGTSIDHQQAATEYSAWAREIRTAGHGISGEELDAHSEILLPKDSSGSPELRHGDTNLNQVAGYFILSAPSFQEAVRLARTCPHLRHGGTIEVRPIVDT